jgi:cyanophycinase-like exopeptidase
MVGPLALVGSGEYTDAMLDVDRGLIDGRPPRYIQIPTAAAPEGPRRLGYWVDLGRRHAERLGVQPVPLIVRDRTEADDPEVAEQVKGAGLIYLSGGRPTFLADTLRETRLWQAIVEAWRSGAALAGCSAGAMAFGDWVPEIRRPGRGRPGLGVLPHIRVIPHFDAFAGRLPDLVLRPLTRAPDGVTVLGVDEDTALVGGPEMWTVRGRQSAWLLGAGRRRQFPVGSTLTAPAPAATGTAGD